MRSHVVQEDPTEASPTATRRQTLQQAPISPASTAQGSENHESGAQPRVVVRSLVKDFDAGKSQVQALRHVDLDVRPGEMVVLLGPSGCGKTTLLRSIAGLEQPSQGEILIDGKRVFSSVAGVWVPPERRNVGMVFQSYALWPHMTVFDNIAYPLQCKRVPKQEIAARVESMMDSVGLPGYGDRLPTQLSGGQQQRVALARAIVADVGVVLFDEPLSNVDAKVREQLRREILRLQREYGFGAIYVTHDQSEAGSLADQLVVMREGQVMEAGKPEELYDRPRSRYVATFMGTANEFAGEVLDDGMGGMTTVETALGAVISAADTSTTRTGSVVAVFRPEACTLTADEPAGNQNRWRCEITQRMFMGAYTEFTAQLVTADGSPGSVLTLRGPAGGQWQVGDRVWVHVPAESVRVLDV